MSPADSADIDRMISAFDAGSLGLDGVLPAIKAGALLADAVQRRRLDVARAILDFVPPGTTEAVFSSLREMLLNMPPWNPSATEFADRRERDVQIVPQVGADRVLFVFCGRAQRAGVPLNLMHRWLAPLGVHVVYLRDLRRIFYLAGIRSLGAGMEAMCTGLKRIASNLGASSIATFGTSAGSYAALRIGMEIGAASILTIGGPTTLERILDQVVGTAANSGIAATELDLAETGLPLPHQALQAWPSTRLVFGEDNDTDRWQAERMANVANMELFPIKGWSHHSLLGPLAASGALQAHLRWLAGRADPGEAVPDAHHAALAIAGTVAA
jgi:hypothetical protein